MHRFLLYLSEIKLTDSTLIIVKLNGGLGNQLFQYAMGRHLSEINQTELKLDISWYEKGIRNYELKYFNIKAGLTTTEDTILITKMTTRWSHRIDRNIIQKLKPYHRRNHVHERRTGFDHSILEAYDNTYLTGYWQSEKYFKFVEPILRQELQFREPMDEKNRAMIRQIRETNAVGLHIRRGDYVSNREYRQTFGICDLSYYRNAILHITSKVPDTRFFVFSDDPVWAKENMGVSNTAFVTHNQGTDSYRDMQLMSLCQHNIIANSTFSWWGAWLNPNPDKIVIAPKNWFADARLHNKDLIPDTWIVL